MPETRIPIELHPDEIRYQEEHFESTWTPGETVGKFQKWIRHWVRPHVDISHQGSVSSLPIFVRPCVKDLQHKWNPFRKVSPEQTYGELFAPVGQKQGITEVQLLTKSNMDALLIWTEEASSLEREDVEAMYPDHVGIEQRGNAWVVYEKMLTTEEKMQRRIDAEIHEARMEEYAQSLRTTDMVTGEEIRTLPFSNVKFQTGDLIQTRFGDALESGNTEDIFEAVMVCDKQGPIKGFASLFSKEEQDRLRTAEPALVAKVVREFYRHILARDVGKIIRQTTRGLEQHIAPLLSSVSNPEARESIARTLKTWETNTQNPTQNLYCRSKRMATETDKNPGRDYVLPTYERNRDFFAVGKLDSAMFGDNVGAGYDPTMNILLLRMREGEADFLDALNAMHELTHKNQHADVIEKTPDHAANHSRYVHHLIHEDTHTSSGVLEEECEAWSNMIELLFAKIGFGEHRVQDVMTSMGIPLTDERKGRELYQIMEYGQLYFAGGGRKGDMYPPAFVEKIRDEYMKIGCSLYVHDAEGFPVPYQA